MLLCPQDLACEGSAWFLEGQLPAVVRERSAPQAGSATGNTDALAAWAARVFEASVGGWFSPGPLSGKAGSDRL